MEDIREGILNLQREKIEQLKVAVKSVRVDEIVRIMQEMTANLIEKYNLEEEGMYKLKMLEAIRKNFEFLVKVADVPFNLPVTQEAMKSVPAVQTIDISDVKMLGMN